ncbi:hypothetical protein [Schlesneria sp. T3-172]|uniref:hypothetical protein n=1 Tax=Schlesneria sphaerica TaxID=3373610 RepID=UPI0037C9C956
MKAQTKMPATYIDDGYTRDDGYIASAEPAKSGERLHDSLSFSYRYATRMEVIKHDAECRIAMKNEETDPTCALQAESLACKFVAEHVSDWDLTNRSGQGVPVSADACARMKSQVFSKLYSIIRGSMVSDPKPAEENDGQSPDEVPSPPTLEELAKN